MQPTSFLPTPPQQGAPWTAQPDDALSQAVARLFREGMADPRGLEYCHVTLLPGSSTWGRAKPVETHGWVLPPGTGSEQRFAIAWNGLVYPVSRVGAPASVESDVESLLGGRSAASASRTSGDGWDESYAVDVYSRLSLKAALLLRLGHDDLARRFWSTRGVDKEPPLLTMGADYFWARFDRALGAHARGDDRLALADLRAIEAAKPLQQEVEQAQAGRAPYYVPWGIGFLAQAPALLADQERREREGARPSPASDESIKMESVAELVRGLEEIGQRQMGQPGGVGLGSDARVQALMRAGDRAVEPLLDVLERDNRLTRSIQFHRDFKRQREVIPVSSAASLILNSIFEASGGSFRRSGGERASRAETVAAMRAYWKKISQVQPYERPLRLLLDDAATPQQWLDAAQEITRPRNVAYRGWPSTSGDSHADTVFVGEPLRGRREPSVSELLRKRALEVARRALETGADDVPNNQIRIANALTLALAFWDARAAAPLGPEMARLTAQYAAKFAQGRTIYTIREEVADSHLRFWRALNRAPDSVIRRSYDATYAAWLVRQPFGAAHASHFKPLWKRANEARWQVIAQKMFGSPQAPWGRLLQERHPPGGGKDLEAMRLLSSPMLKLPAFRGAVERGLRDRARAGTSLIHAQGYAEIKGDSGWSSSHPIPEGERALCASGTQTTFRACDLIASNLFERAKGEAQKKPLCQLYWPQSRRDAAVARALRLLRAGALYADPNPFWAIPD